MVDDLCVGCYRTLDEIAAWGSMDDSEKLDTLRILEERTPF